MNPVQVQAVFSRHHCSDRPIGCRPSVSVRPTLLFKSRDKKIKSQPPHSSFSSLLEARRREINLGPVDRDWFEKASQHGTDGIQDETHKESPVSERSLPSLQITETPRRHHKQTTKPQLYFTSPSLFSPEDKHSAMRHQTQLKANNSLNDIMDDSSPPITPNMPSRASGFKKTDPTHHLDISPSSARDDIQEEIALDAMLHSHAQTTPHSFQQLFKTHSSITKLGDMSITTPGQFLSTPLRLSISLGVDLDDSNFSWTSSLATPQDTMSSYPDAHQESTVVAKALFRSMMETTDHPEEDPDSQGQSLHLQSLHMSSAEQEATMEDTLRSEESGRAEEEENEIAATEGVVKHQEDEGEDERKSRRREMESSRHCGHLKLSSHGDEENRRSLNTKETPRMRSSERCQTKTRGDEIEDICEDAETDEGDEDISGRHHHSDLVLAYAVHEAGAATRGEEKTGVDDLPGASKDGALSLIPDRHCHDHCPSLASPVLKSLSQTPKQSSQDVEPTNPMRTETLRSEDASILNKSNLSSLDQSRMEDTLAFFILTPPQTRRRLAKLKKQNLERKQSVPQEVSCLEGEDALLGVTAPDKCSLPEVADEITRHNVETDGCPRAKTELSVIRVREEDGSLKESLEDLSGITQSQIPNSVPSSLDGRCNIERTKALMEEHAKKSSVNVASKEMDVRSVKGLSQEVLNQSATDLIFVKVEDIASVEVAQSPCSLSPIRNPHSALLPSSYNAASPEVFSQISPNYEEALRHITDQASEFHQVKYDQLPRTGDVCEKPSRHLLEMPSVSASSEINVTSHQDVPTKTECKEACAGIPTITSKAEAEQGKHLGAESDSTLNDSQGLTEEESPGQLFRMKPKTATTHRFFYPSSTSDTSKTKGPKAMQWLSEAVLIKAEEKEQTSEENLSKSQTKKTEVNQPSSLGHSSSRASSAIHTSTPASRNAAFVTFSNFVQSDASSLDSKPAPCIDTTKSTDVNSLHTVTSAHAPHQPVSCKKTASAKAPSNSTSASTQATPLSRKTSVLRSSSTNTGMRCCHSTFVYGMPAAKRLNMSSDKEIYEPHLNEAIKDKIHETGLENNSEAGSSAVAERASEFGRERHSESCSRRRDDVKMSEISSLRCKTDAQSNSSCLGDVNQCDPTKPCISRQDVSTRCGSSLGLSRDVCDEAISVSVSGNKEQSEPHLADVPKTVAFSSASGRAIRISDSALQKAKAAFDNDDRSSVHSKNSANLTDEESCDEKDAFNKTGLNPIPSKVSFMAASGRAIQISKAALQKAKLSFLEDDIKITENMDTLAKMKSTSNASSGKTVSFISARSGTQPSKIQHQDSGRQVSGSRGVSAAQETSHSPHQLHKTTTHSLSLHKTQASSESISDSSSAPSTSKSDNVIGDTTQQKARDLSNKTPQDQVPVLVGFASANGKPISVSETALQTAKKLFEEGDAIQLNVGFSTGSGRSIEIPESALTKAKALFEEFEDCDRPASDQIDSSVDTLQETREVRNGSSLSTRLQPKSQSHNLPKGFRPFKAPKKVIPLTDSCPASSETPVGRLIAPVRNSSLPRTGTSHIYKPSGASLKSLRSIPEASVLASSPDVPHLPRTESLEFEESLSASQAQREIEAAEEMESAYAFMQAEDDGFSQFDDPVICRSSLKGAGLTAVVSSRGEETVTMDEEAEGMAGQVVSVTREEWIQGSPCTQSVSHSNVFSQASSQASDNHDKAFLQSQGSAAEETETSTCMPHALDQDNINHSQKEQRLKDSSCISAGSDIAPNAKTQNSVSSTNEFTIQKVPQLTEARNNHPKQDCPTFLGFQTAGGKQVKISEEALKRAKNVFAEDELLDCDTSHPESHQDAPTCKVGLDPCDQQKDHSKLLGECDEDEDTSSRQSKRRRIDTEPRAPDHGPKFSGFSTASGNKVTVSKTALQNAKKLFEGCDKGEGMSLAESATSHSEDKQAFKGFSTASGNKVTVSKTALQNAKKLFEGCDKGEGMSLAESATSHSEDKQAFKGFSTASGNKVTVSKTALQNAKKLFEGCDKGEGMSLAESATSHSDDKQAFKGFSTASGNKVTVSKTALQNAKKLFEGCDKGEGMSLAESATSHSEDKQAFKGFSTASGNKVTVSKTALENAKKLFEGCDKGEGTSLAESATSHSEDKQAFKGFSTANGNKVTVSKTALQNAKKLFEGFDKVEGMSLAESATSHSEDKQAFKGFSTASGNKVTVSKTALQNAKKLFEGFDKVEGMSLAESATSHSEDKQAFKGFSTASGNKVTVSKTALENAKKLFEGCDKGEGMSLAESATSHSEDKQAFKGFSTASGNKVTVSKTALENAKKLFEGFDKVEGMSLAESATSHSEDKQAFKGFSTANGNKVTVSKTALENAKKLFEGFDKGEGMSLAESATSHSEDKQAFKGFSTASGNKVTVSKTALENAKKLFEGCDKGEGMSLAESATNHSEDKQAFKGFLTASGNKVTVSKTALENAKKLFEGCDKGEGMSLAESATSHSEDKQAFKGFSTASGNKVTVSKTALQNAKKLFEGFDKVEGMSLAESATSHSEDKQAFKGFSTANGNKVTVSKTALQNAKKLFEGCDKGEGMSLAESATSHSEDKQAFKGFSTANGNKVTVSKTALENAKKLFEEPDHDACSGNSTILDGKDFAYQRTPSDLGVGGSVPLGFQTASGTAVPVSRNSLQKAQALLRDDRPQDVNPGASTSRKDLHKPVALPTPSTRIKTVSSRQLETSSACSDAVVPEQEAKTLPSTPVDPNTTRRGAFKSRALHQQQGSSRYQQRFATPFTRQGDSTPSISTSAFQPPKQRARQHQPDTPQVVPQMRKAALPSQQGPSSPHVDAGHTLPSPSNKRCLENESTSTDPPSKRSKICGNDPRVSRRQEVEDALMSAERKVDADCLRVWREARRNQAERIQNKRRQEMQPQRGDLLSKRQDGVRIALWELVNAQPPAKYSRRELLEEGVLPETLKITSCTAEDFKFSLSAGAHGLSSSDGQMYEDGAQLVPDVLGQAGKQEFFSALLATPGVDPKYVKSDWLSNHYRWIVWKLASMEIAYPHQFARRYLTPAQVLLQLKYRYDREIDHAQRPALKKIMERDDTPSKRMVLCVAGIHHPETFSNIESDQMGTSGKDTEKGLTCSLPSLELTDGWYSIRTAMDKPLAGLVQDGKIYVGLKLCIYGAELIGSQDACSPLEAPSSLRLKISGNGTRRARYNAKLGFQPCPKPFPLPLGSLYHDGGTVGCVEVIIVRSYPMQFMEKMEGCGCVFRGRRSEEREEERSSLERQRKMDRLLSRLQEDYQADENRKVSSNPRASPSLRLTNQQVAALSTGQEVYEAVTNAMDPGALQDLLSDRQMSLLTDYQRSLHERKQSDLQVHFRRALEEAKQDRSIERNVTPLLRLRVSDALSQSSKEPQTYQLTVWRPTDEVMHLLTEGKRIKIFNVTTSSGRFCMGTSSVQLSSTRSTRYHAMLSSSSLASACSIYTSREVLIFSQTQTPGFKPAYGEVDVVGIVVMIDKAKNSPGKSSSEMVYMSDAQRNIIAVKFWGGLQAQCLESLLKPSSCLALSSLQWRTNSCDSSIPCFHANDATSVTHSPKSPHLQQALKELQTQIKDAKAFAQIMEHCVMDKMTTLRSSKSQTPRQDMNAVYESPTLPRSGSRLSQGPDATPVRRHTGASLTPYATPHPPDMGHLRPHATSTPLARNESYPRQSTPDNSSLDISSMSNQYMKKRQDAGRRFDLLTRVPSPPPLSPLPTPLPNRTLRGFRLPSSRRSLPQLSANHKPGLSNTPGLRGHGLGVKCHSLSIRNRSGNLGGPGLKEPSHVQRGSVEWKGMEGEVLGPSLDADGPRPDSCSDEDMTASQRQVQEVLGMSYKSLGEIDWDWTQQVDAMSPPDSITIAAQGSQDSSDLSYDTPGLSSPIKKAVDRNVKGITLKDSKLEDGRDNEDSCPSSKVEESCQRDSKDEDTLGLRPVSRKSCRMRRKRPRVLPFEAVCSAVSPSKNLRSEEDPTAAKDGNPLRSQHQETTSEVKVCVNASTDMNVAETQYQSLKDLSAKRPATPSVRCKDGSEGNATSQVEQAVKAKKKRRVRSTADLSILEHSNLLISQSLPPTRRLTRSAHRHSATSSNI